MQTISRPKEVPTFCWHLLRVALPLRHCIQNQRGPWWHRVQRQYAIDPIFFCPKSMAQGIYNANFKFLLMLKVGKQSSKLVKVYFIILSSIQKRMHNNFILNAICALSHIISIIGYLVLIALTIVPKITQGGSTIIVWNNIRYLFAIPAIIIFCTISTVFALQWAFFNQFGTLQDHKQIIKINRIVAFFAYYFLEVTYFPANFLFLNFFSRMDDLTGLDYCSIIIGCILQVIQTSLLNSKRIYGNYSLLIPLLLVFLNPYIGVASVFGVTIISFYRDNTNSQENKCDNIMYFAIAVTCLWSYLQLIVHKQDAFPVTACINLIVVIFGSVGAYIIFPINFNLGNQLMTNKKLFKIFMKEDKSQSQNSEQFHRVDLFEEMGFQKYIQESEKSQQACRSRKLTDTASYQWQQQQKKQLLWQKIKLGKCSDNSFESFMFYFRSGFLLKIQVLKLLKQLASYLNRTQDLNLTQRYQIYRLVEEITENYEETNGIGDGYMQISDVVEIQRNYFNYYLQIDELLFELVEFWKDMIVNQFNVNDQIEEKIELVSQLERAATFSLSKLKHHRIKQEQRLYNMIHSITNGYQPIKQYSEIIKLQKSSSFEYIVLENEQINKISLRLIKSLGFEPDSINTHLIRSFLPCGFTNYLEEIQQKYLQENQQSPFILPVVNSQGCIQVKKCLLYLVPKIDSSLQYLMTFQNIEATAKIFFLYNVGKQKIEIFSESFKNFIGMKQQSFSEFLNSDSVLFPSDIFQTDIEAEQLSLLRGHEILKTKIIYSDFYLRKNNIYNYNDEVNLHLEHEFTFTGHNYLLINVFSESYRQAKADEETRSQANININLKQKQLYNQYANQQFFCKIQNPFKSKIIEKLGNINSRTYKSYFYRIFIINLAIFFLIIGNIISFKVLSSSLVQKGQDITKIMYNFNNEYLFILRLYSGTFSNAFFRLNTNDTSSYLNREFFGSNGTSSQLSAAILELEQYYQKANINNSQKLMSTYLLYKEGIQNHPQMPFKVVFDEFTIDTSTQLTAFYDFVVQVEQGYNDGTAIDFLLQNYKQILKILTIYLKEAAFFSDFKAQFDSVMLAGYLFIFLLSLLLVISFITILKMVKIHQKIYSLYHFADKSDAKKIIKDLTKIKQQIGEISLKGDDRMRNQLYSSLMQQTTLNSKRVIKLEAGSQVQQNKQKTSNTLMKAFKLLFFYPLAFAITLFVIYLQYNSIDKNRTDYSEILSLLQKIQQDQLIQQKLFSDIFYPSFYYIKYQQLPNVRSGVVLKNQFYSPKLPRAFMQDFRYEENICQTTFVLEKIPYFFLSTAECEKMQLGVLTKGYSQAFQFYSTYLRQQATIPLDQYLKDGIYSDKNKLKEIIFLKEILVNYLRNKKLKLMSNFGEYLAQVNQEKIEVMIFAIAAGFLFLILMIYKIYLLKKRLNIVISLLCIMPTTSMYKMATTNYIRKNGILQQIDRL